VRLLENALRLTSILGMIVAVLVFLTVAFLAKLSETWTAAILSLCLLELIRDYLTLRYIKRARMDLRRLELETYKSNQWYSDRR
jgi:uncharacterized membrane protein